MAEVHEKDSREKIDPNEITHEDLNLLNIGLSPSDRNFIHSSDDPRLAKLKQYTGFNELMVQLRKDAERINEESGADIFDKERRRKKLSEYVQQMKEKVQAIKETGTSKALPAEERPARISTQEFVARSKAGIKQTKKFSPEEVERIYQKMDADLADALREVGIKRPTGEISITGRMPAEEVEPLKERVQRTETELAKYKTAVSKSIALIQEAVGEKDAHRFKKFPDSIVKLLKLMEYKNILQKTLESRVGVLDQQSKERQKISEDAFNMLFSVFSSFYADPAEGLGYFSLFGKPILKMLSSCSDDDVKITREPGKAIKINLQNDEFGNKLLPKIMESYNKLLEQACMNVTQTRAVARALRAMLEKSGIDSADIEKAVRAAEHSLDMPKHLEMRKKIDRDVRELSKDDLGILYNDANQKLGEANKLLDILQSQKAGLAGRREDIIAINDELRKIRKIFEDTGLDSRNGIIGSDISSSKIIESFPDELKKIREAVIDKIVEAAGLQEEIEEKDKIIESQKEEIAEKKRPALVLDPFFRRIYGRFLAVDSVFKKYAIANSFIPDPLARVSPQSENAVVVVLENYKSLLEQLKQSIEVDTASAEKRLERTFASLVKKLPGDLRRKKDIMYVRENIEGLIESEENRIKKSIVAGKRLVPALLREGNISQDALLAKTGYEKADVACISSYVFPLYELVIKLDALPKMQNELAAKYGFDSFEELRREANRLYEKAEAKESVFREAKMIASKSQGLSVKTRKDATALVRDIKAYVDELANINEEAIRREIMSNCIIPKASYEDFAIWLEAAYKQLAPVANGETQRAKICSLVSRIDETAGRNYRDSMEFLRAFVNDAAFSEVNEDLNYFAPLKMVFNTDFCSGQELLKVVNREINQVNKYIRSEKTRLERANKLTTTK